jgi:NAD-dependent SIR2 family protein deacetylase
MVTNYPQQLTATADVAPAGSDRVVHDHSDGVVARAMGRLGQLYCGLRGHDSVLHFEGSRVNMRCTSCGHDTPGWEISGRGPRRRYEGDARRHRLVRERLVLRKTA